MKKTIRTVFNKSKPLLKSAWTKIKTSPVLRDYGNNFKNHLFDSALQILLNKMDKKHHNKIRILSAPIKKKIDNGYDNMYKIGEEFIDKHIGNDEKDANKIRHEKEKFKGSDL